MKLRIAYILVALNVLVFISGWQSRELAFYMLSHANGWHLAINSLAILSFAIGVEKRWGRLATVLVYVIGALIGGVLHALASDAALVGSSAGIFALMAVYALSYPLRKALWVTTSVGFLVGVIFMTLTSVTFGLLPQVSHWAHLGGLMTGLLFFFAFDEGEQSKKFDDINKRLP